MMMMMMMMMMKDYVSRWDSRVFVQGLYFGSPGETCEAPSSTGAVTYDIISI
jgi:hypothetical protein